MGRGRQRRCLSPALVDLPGANLRAFAQVVQVVVGESRAGRGSATDGTPIWGTLRHDFPLPLRSDHSFRHRAPMKFTVATYNIHKGFSQLNRRMVIHELRERLHGLVRRHPVPAGGAWASTTGTRRGYHDWPGKPQHEFIADTIWHEVAYGTQRGLPPRPSRQRGAVALPDRRAGEPRHLGARVREPRPAPLRDQARRRARRRCIASTSTSGLFERGRQWQIHALCERIRATVPRRRAARSSPATSTTGGTRRNRMLVDELGVVRGVRGGARAAGAHVSVGDAGVPPRPHLRARARRSSTRTSTTRFPSGRISDHAALAATFDTAAPRAR